MGSRPQPSRPAVAGGAFPPGFVDGVRHFNAGRFFEAHEAFEAQLDAVESDDRWDLLVGLVQVAVGYHKWSSGHPGAARMLRLGRQKLDPFPPGAWGLGVAALCSRLDADLAALEGPAPPPAPSAPPPAIRLAARGER